MMIYKKLVARLFLVTVLTMALAVLAKPTQVSAFCSCTTLINSCRATCQANPNSQDCIDCNIAVDGCLCGCFHQCN